MQSRSTATKISSLRPPPSLLSVFSNVVVTARSSLRFHTGKWDQFVAFLIDSSTTGGNDDGAVVMGDNHVKFVEGSGMGKHTHINNVNKNVDVVIHMSMLDDKRIACLSRTCMLYVVSFTTWELIAATSLGSSMGLMITYVADRELHQRGTVERDEHRCPVLVCGIVWIDFDHYCTWVGACIARGTYCWFVLFLLATTFLS